MYGILRGLTILAIKSFMGFCGGMMTIGVCIIVQAYGKTHSRAELMEYFTDHYNVHVMSHGILMALGCSLVFIPLFLGMTVLRPMGDAMEERIEEEADDFLSRFGISE